MHTTKCIFVLGLWSLFFSGGVTAIEEPKYTIIEKEGNIELRNYAPKIIAEVLVSGSVDDAGRTGFKLIAGYIFGDNTARTGEKQKISMTAPVTMEAASEKISMTAPVTMSGVPDVSSASNMSHDGKPNTQQWRMHFVMPSQYTLDTLPIPNNSAVILRKIPAKNYAVIRFSGFTGDGKVAKKTATLLTWLTDNNIPPKGKPEFARYNPPWTLPFLRRNEVMMEY